MRFQMPRDGVTRWGIAAYSAPAFATYFLLNPTWSIVPGVYAKYYGLNLTAIGSAVLMARLVDAFADPIVGFLSDRHRAAGGLRKNWVMAGGAGVMASAYFLYVPSPGIGISYFLGWSIGFFVCWTLCEIPALAWGKELASSTAGRARVFGWRTSFVFAGHTVFFIVPFLPLTSGRDFTPQLMKAAFIVGAICMGISLVLSFLFAPNGAAPPNQDPNTGAGRRLASVFRNGPLLNFAVFFLLTNIGLAMWYGVMYLFLSSYLGFTEHIAAIFLVSSVTGFFSIPVWVGLVKRFGAKFVLAAGLVVFMLMLGFSVLLSPQVSWLAALASICVGFIVLAITNVAPAALLADISDYGAWKFKVDASATYFAASTLLSKASYAIGVALALWIAGRYSFDPAASEQTVEAIRGIHLAYSVVPIVLVAAGTIALIRAPLDRRRMEIIQRWHARGAGRAAARDPTAVLVVARI